jgi:hypothetical protein
MRSEADDFDWAFGELLHLFSVACRSYRMPHEIDPALFYEAWTLLNAQPFEVRDKCHKRLMEVWSNRPAYRTRFSPKRYENIHTH